MGRKKYLGGSAQPPPSPLPHPPTAATVAPSPALSPMAGRRQPVILKKPARPGRRCAELAGGTAAECAAVWCCFPCAVVDLVVLAVVRLPAGLCRRAIRARNRRKAKAIAVKKTARAKDDGDGEDGIGLKGAAVVVAAPSSPAPEEDVEKLEKEMWARFSGAGFWRSPSQREEER